MAFSSANGKVGCFSLNMKDMVGWKVVAGGGGDGGCGDGGGEPAVKNQLCWTMKIGYF